MTQKTTKTSEAKGENPPDAKVKATEKANEGKSFQQKGTEVKK